MFDTESENGISGDESSGEEEQAPKPMKKRNKQQTKKRKKFTKKEDKAISDGVERLHRKGVRVFGEREFDQIQQCYSNELIGRTGKNVNDRWRTLNNKAASLEPPMEIDRFMKSQEYLDWNQN